MHMHDLLTSEQHERMLANGWREQTDDSFDPEPVVKLILPGLGMAWLLTSLDPDSPEIAFGLCGLGFGTPELGSVSLDELAEGTGPLGPKVCRDPGFVARKPLSACANDARKGPVNHHRLTRQRRPAAARPVRRTPTHPDARPLRRLHSGLASHVPEKHDA
jgi:hypothetical protein